MSKAMNCGFCDGKGGFCSGLVNWKVCEVCKGVGHEKFPLPSEITDSEMLDWIG